MTVLKIIGLMVRQEFRQVSHGFQRILYYRLIKKIRDTAVPTTFTRSDGTEAVKHATLSAITGSMTFVITP